MNGSGGEQPRIPFYEFKLTDANKAAAALRFP